MVFANAIATSQVQIVQSRHVQTIVPNMVIATLNTNVFATKAFIIRIVLRNNAISPVNIGVIVMMVFVSVKKILLVHIANLNPVQILVQIKDLVIWVNVCAMMASKVQIVLRKHVLIIATPMVDVYLI